MEKFKLVHTLTGTVIAKGRAKDGLKKFEGNYYIKKKYFSPGVIKPNYIPGLCFYKFVYVWMDLILPSDDKIKNVGWWYVLPNPIFFIVIGRIGIPQNHPELTIEKS